MRSVKSKLFFSSKLNSGKLILLIQKTLLNQLNLDSGKSTPYWLQSYLQF